MKDKKKIAWKIIYNVFELLVIAVGLLTFCGERYIGVNIPLPIFMVVLSLFLIYPVYKVVLKIFERVEKFNGKKN